MFNAFSKNAVLFSSVFALALVSYDVKAESLEDALVEAYKNNPTLHSQRVYLKSVDESVPQALSGWRPSVSASGDITRKTSEATVSGVTADRTWRSPYSASINFSQAVFNGFQTINQTKSAEYNVLSQRAELENVEQGVLLQAAEVYLDVYSAEAVLKLRINNEQVLKRQLEAARDRYRVGEITLTDVSQSEARFSGANAERIKAEGDLQAARATYKSVIGTMPESLDKPLFDDKNLPENLEQTIEISSVRNPSVVSAEYSAKSARKNIKVVRSELLPSVSLGGYAGRSWDQSSSDDRTDTYYAKASVSVPLYSAGAVTSRLRAAKYQAGQARIGVDVARRSVVESATSAWENLQATKAAIESRKAQIKASKIALDGVEKEAQVGSRTVLDVLDAEQELLDAKVALVQSERDEMLASFQLLSSLGRLTAQELKLDVDKYNPEKHYSKTRGKWYGFDVDLEKKIK